MRALEFAINMEIEGEKYYAELAEKNKGNKLHVVFALLADEEKKHADILKNHTNALAYTLEENPAFSGMQSVFAGIEYGSKPELKMYIEQVDVYRDAREKEKQSIELYTKMLGESNNATEKELFAFLIEQEKDHFGLMDNLVMLLERSNKVVSAEFGLTNDY
ncbi:MAG: ferritin-like domain-containing protein [Bacillota bacterium]